jgi:hypothetical protein
MPATRKITEMIFGAPLDPFSKETRRHVAPDYSAGQLAPRRRASTASK